MRIAAGRIAAGRNAAGRNAAGVLVLAASLLACGQAQRRSGGEAAREPITAEQLTALLEADAGKNDAAFARELSAVELTQRLSAGRLARLSAAVPGDRSRQALLIVADSAALLDPPPGEVRADATPDAAALRQMLVQVVNYVNTSLHRLPNFIATRTTTAFEDRPAEDVQEPTGMVSYSYLPLHAVGGSSMEVTVRDGHEALASDRRSSAGHARGLVTAGEFGPFLRTVLGDAVKGKITWARWEQGTDGAVAVFRYEAPKEKSHYAVEFCCTRESLSESVATHVYHELAAYHGEITFNPATGAVLRMTAIAEPTPGELVEQAAMVMEYGPVEIAGRTVILPTRSVSLLKAHTTAPPAGMHMAIFKGPPKTFLNDVEFKNYHQFRGEMRIVTEESGAPGAVATPQP